MLATPDRSTISIHALREEGDRDLDVHDFVAGRFLSTPSARRATGTSMFTTLLSGDFYPRPPRGGRPPSGRNTPDTPNFYPRPPRGGRLTARGSITPGINFYPRPPRGGRPAGHCGPRRTIIISIHALREEGDHVQSFAGEGIEGFLSTPSARRATGIGYVIQRPSIISIHALREEGD